MSNNPCLTLYLKSRIIKYIQLIKGKKMSVNQKSKINTVFDEFVKYGIITAIGFFLVNFHNDSKSTSKNTAMLVTVMTQVKEDLKENKVVDDKQDEDIKKIGNGLITLTTRFNYIEGK